MGSSQGTGKLKEKVTGWWVGSDASKKSKGFDGAYMRTEEEEEEDRQNRKITQSVYQVKKAIFKLLVVGVLAAALFSFIADSAAPRISVFGALLLISSAAGVVAGLVGFLFGIPKILQNPPQNLPIPNDDDTGESGHERSYLVNTNLEEVSDWLTKMLVGVGLTQLTSAPGWLWSVSGTFTRSLGLDRGGDVVICSLLLYFSAVGLLTGYLMTRLYLSRALATADGTLHRIKKVKSRERDRERIASIDMMVDDLSQSAKVFLRENWIQLESEEGFVISEESVGNQDKREALRALLGEKLLVEVLDSDGLGPGKRVRLTKLARKLRNDLREMLGAPKTEL